MNFEKLFAISLFLIGAAFSLIDIGSDSYLAYEYWNNSEHQSFQHCLENRITNVQKYKFREQELDVHKRLKRIWFGVNESEYMRYSNKNQLQMRDDLCKNWREKWLKAVMQTNYLDCVKTLLKGTNVSDLSKLESNIKRSFYIYTLFTTEVLLMKIICSNVMNIRWISVNSSTNFHEVVINDIYKNEEDCHLYYRTTINFTFKTMLHRFNLTKEEVKFVAILTTIWIVAGGCFQFLIVLYLYRRRDSRFDSYSASHSIADFAWTGYRLRFWRFLRYEGYPKSTDPERCPEVRSPHDCSNDFIIH